MKKVILVSFFLLFLMSIHITGAMDYNQFSYDRYSKQLTFNDTFILRFLGWSYKKPYQNEIFINSTKNTEDINISIEFGGCCKDSKMNETYVSWTSLKINYSSKSIIDYICPIVFDFGFWPEKITTELGDEKLISKDFNTRYLILQGKNISFILYRSSENIFYRVSNNEGITFSVCSSKPQLDIYLFNTGLFAVGSLDNTKLLKMESVLEHPPTIVVGEEQCIDNTNSNIISVNFNYSLFVIENTTEKIAVVSNLSKLTNGKVDFFINNNFDTLQEKTKCLDDIQFSYKTPYVGYEYFKKINLTAYVIVPSGEQKFNTVTVYVFSNETIVLLLLSITSIINLIYFLMKKTKFYNLKTIGYVIVINLIAIVSPFPLSGFVEDNFLLSFKNIYYYTSMSGFNIIFLLSFIIFYFSSTILFSINLVSIYCLIKNRKISRLDIVFLLVLFFWIYYLLGFTIYLTLLLLISFIVSFIIVLLRKNGDIKITENQ